ncbi:hypothetical protein [Sphingomonas glaciei]|uniref:Uncharacterized protein n=1 Tax=Sphingomonas glaciei TaxID=2938948 RepID=A0ABY5MX50_9SPHN|nr:hypothetical protein [Sphingomonas glaciei]UUR06946.1 hypothetical protein M1K48_08235 [Sphingomonas glaciei]
MTKTRETIEGRTNYLAAAFRVAVVALKLLCVYALSQQDAAFFYQQF